MAKKVEGVFLATSTELNLTTTELKKLLYEIHTIIRNLLEVREMINNIPDVGVLETLCSDKATRCLIIESLYTNNEDNLEIVIDEAVKSAYLDILKEYIKILKKININSIKNTLEMLNATVNEIKFR